jgi:signal transduction histidine kinase
LEVFPKCHISNVERNELKVRNNLFASLNEYLNRQSKALLFTYGIISALIVGAVDYATGSELSVVVFYLLPISLVAWSANRKTSVVMCIISAGIEFLANSAAGQTYSHYLIAFWNSSMLLSFFLIYVFVLLAMKTEYTAKVNLINKLENALSELDLAKKDLEQKAQELSRSNDDLKEFAYAISHDLKEPLRVIDGFVKLLVKRYKGNLSSDADNFMEYIVDAVQRMQLMIKDLLDYSLVGTKVKDLELIDSALVIEQALLNLQTAVEESGAEVTFDPLPKVMADASQLVRLFQNLIGNAIKFRGKKALKIHISSEQKDDEWIFSVRDNGIGIDRNHFGRIFLIFQRLHTREEYDGTGIGLAICKKIVERHSGRIWVESEPGKGSTFYFTIPTDRTEA